MECGHTMCTCQTEGDEFCGDACRQMEGGGAAPDATGEDCGCGHPQCIARTTPMI